MSTVTSKSCLSEISMLLIFSVVLAVSSTPILNDIPLPSTSSTTTLPLPSNASPHVPSHNDTNSKQGNLFAPRSLVVGDFQDLNEILLNSAFRLPSMSNTDGGTTLSLSDIICKNVNIGDIRLVPGYGSTTSETDLSVEVVDLDMRCQARYYYDGGFLLTGRGSVDVVSLDNRVVLESSVKAPSASAAPTQVIIDSCRPSININDVDFDGGFLGWILNLIKSLARGIMENLVEDMFCSELAEALISAEEILENVKTQLDKYQLSPGDLDPLQAEKALLTSQSTARSAAASSILVDLQNPQSSFGQWVNNVLNQGVDYLRTVAVDPSNPSQASDLRANIMIRDFVLDDDRSLVVDTSSIALPNGQEFLFYSHNRLMETTFHLDKVKLLGLDTLKQFDPLAIIGKYTMQTEMSWDYLLFEIDATMEIKPSSLPDAIVDNNANGNIGIVEDIRVVMGLGDLQASVALLAAIQQELLEKLQLGSLLKKEDFLPCVLSTIFATAVSSLSVEAGDVYHPYLSGFVSVGLDKLFESVLDAGFLMYEDILLRSAPGYFQKDLRLLLNEKFIDETIDQSASCPLLEISETAASTLVDFRDLFLDPALAAQRGGSGEEPYGNIISSFLGPNLETQVMQVDKLNDQIIRTFTKAQSGVEGAIFADGNFLRFQSESPTALFDAAVLDVSNVRVYNLDTVIDPLNILDARDRNLLYNTITFQSESRPVKITASVLIAIGDDSSPLSMTNQIELSFIVPSATVALGILANIHEEDLLGFPLTDVTNPYCWMSALASTMDKGLVPFDIESLALFLSTFSFDATCIACSSPAAPFLSQLLRELEDFGFQFQFASRILELAQEVLLSLWRGVDLSDLLSKAPMLCPHSDSYDPSAEKIAFSFPQITDVSSNAMETILGVGIIFLQATIIVAAKNHILSQDQYSFETGEANIPAYPDTLNIVDWTNLSSEMGPWADFGFVELRKHLLEPVKSDEKLSTTIKPRIVRYIEETLLDESGAYIFKVDKNIEAMGFEIHVSQVTIDGLGEIGNVDVLTPADPYTLRNKMSFDELVFTVDTNITAAGETNQLQLQYTARNLLMNMDVLVAMDLDKLREIKIGSIFNVDDILSCAAAGIHEVKISKLDTAIEFISDPTITGFFSVAYRDSIDWVLQSMLNAYRKDIMDAAPIFFATTFSDMINALLPDLTTSIQEGCPNVPRYSSQGLVDFRDLLLPQASAMTLGGSGKMPYGNLFQELYDVLVENVLMTGASNRPLVNDIFRYITEAHSNETGSFQVDGDAVNSQTSFKIAGLEADIGFRVADIAFHQIDSVGDPLEVLRPVMDEGNIVENIVSFGVDSKPLSVSATIELTVTDGVEMNIRNEIEIDFSLEDVVLMADVILKISERSFSTFPIRDLNNINCWLATVLSPNPDQTVAFRGIGLDKYSLSIGDFQFDLKCAKCSSPYFDKLLLSLYDFENVTDVETIVQEQLSGIVDTDFFPVFLDEVVVDSAKRCPHHENYDPNASPASFLTSPGTSLGFLEVASNGKSASYFNILNAFIVIFLFLFGFLARRIVKEANKKWIASLSREGKKLLEDQQSKDAHMQMMLNASTTSLFKSSMLPRRVRYGVPVAIVLNIALYMIGHFGTLSTINIDAGLAGEEFTIYEFIEFRFFKSTANTFQNGGAVMAVLLWLFTGVWPYVKLLLSLFLWVMPPQRLNVKRRGQGLLWIDALAKLSVVDIFTMLLGFAVLLIFIGGPDESLSQQDIALYSFKAIIVPGAGFYCLLIAQRMSRVSSRYLLEQHETVVTEATKSFCKPKLLEDDSSDIKIVESDASTGSNLLLDTEEDDASEIRSLMGRINEASKRVYGDDEEMTSSPSVTLENDQSSTSGDRSIERLPSDDDYASNDDKPQQPFQWGSIGVTLGGVTVCIIFVIGCIFAPAVSLDASSITSLAVDSKLTYEEVVNRYGVFLVMSSILVQAKFDLNSRLDYIGFGFLLFGGLASIACVFFMQAYQFIKRKMRERQLGPVLPAFGHRGCGFPLYFRLYKWKHMEIYLISMAIGIWQLGSACAYAIHLYCDILYQIYSVMSYLGMIEDSSAQCTRIQASLPGNLTIIAGSFGILIATFGFQAAAQYRKNIADAIRFIDKDDFPRLSLAWSKDRSKNSKYSHLTSSLSIMDGLSSRWLPEIPSTPTTHAMTPPATPSREDEDNDDEVDLLGQTGVHQAPIAVTVSSPFRSLSSPLFPQDQDLDRSSYSYNHNHSHSHSSLPPQSQLQSQSQPLPRRTTSVRFEAPNDDAGSMPPRPPPSRSDEAPSSVVPPPNVFRLAYRSSSDHEALL